MMGLAFGSCAWGNPFYKHTKLFSVDKISTTSLTCRSIPELINITGKNYFARCCYDSDVSSFYMAYFVFKGDPYIKPNGNLPLIWCDHYLHTLAWNNHLG